MEWKRHETRVKQLGETINSQDMDEFERQHQRMRISLREDPLSAQLSLEGKKNMKTNKPKGGTAMTQERFKQVLKVMEEVHGTKNEQYAGENGYLSNLKMCEAMRIPAWKGVIVRMTDKMARLMNLSNIEGSELQKEITDAFIDMGVYSGMGLIAYEDSHSGNRDADPSREGKPAKARRARRKKPVQSPLPLESEERHTEQTA